MPHGDTGGLGAPERLHEETSPLGVLGACTAAVGVVVPYEARADVMLRAPSGSCALPRTEGRQPNQRLIPALPARESYLSKQKQQHIQSYGY